jgi:pilus assembly protein CpaC
LMVRVAEVNRSKLRELGSSYLYQSSPGSGGFVSGGGPGNLSSAANGILTGAFGGLNLFVLGGNAATMIKAMQTNGALRSLAEPNLIAMNGQEASFLAGGEFPIPVIQSSSSAGVGSAVTIIFKEYGVRLNFKPTIIDEDHIRLELEPEVSTLDSTNGVRFEGFLIPALRTRRAKTGIELRDGQSFALAGLLDNSETQSLSKIPGIGDIPIIGNLFKSKNFQKNETELMFIVTAQMVKPVNRDDVPRLPNVESLRNGSLLGIEPKSGDLKGPSGFMINSSGQSESATPNMQPVVTPKVDGPAAVPATNGTTNKPAVPDVSEAAPAPAPAGEKKPNPNQ